MIPLRFTLDAVETGQGGTEDYSVPVEFVVCAECGCLVAVERLDRHPHPTSGEEAVQRAVREPLVKLTEPKPPRNDEDITRWQTLALEKWLWYRDTVWPSSNDIAQRMHSHALAKIIPFLLGRPDLALDDSSPEAVAASYDKTEHEPVSVVDAYGPHSDILPDAADYNEHRRIEH